MVRISGRKKDTAVPCEDTVLCEVGEEIGNHCSGIICLIWNFPSRIKCTHVFTMWCLLFLISPGNSYLGGRRDLTLRVFMKRGGKCESLDVRLSSSHTDAGEVLPTQQVTREGVCLGMVTRGFPCHLTRGP